jgi:hypothetical protein
LRYFPWTIPEELLWDEEYIKAFPCLNTKIFAEINKSVSYKKKILSFAREVTNTSGTSTHEAIIHMLAKHFVETQSDECQRIKDIINRFKAIYESRNS